MEEHKELSTRRWLGTSSHGSPRANVRSSLCNSGSRGEIIETARDPTGHPEGQGLGQLVVDQESLHAYH